MNRFERVDLEPALVLHARPYREASLLVEAFSRGHGRLGLIARGVRRPKSRTRGLLQPFIPLLLSWRGRGDLPTLTGAESDGGAIALAGSAAIVGLYLNELLLRFVHRHDPEPDLFDRYRATLVQISHQKDPEPALRIFEKRLLETVGYALELENEVDSGQAIRPDGLYHYSSGSGPTPWAKRASTGVCVSGSTLIALAREQLAEPRVLKEAKLLMRAVIDEHCAGNPLQSRRLWTQ